MDDEQKDFALSMDEDAEERLQAMELLFSGGDVTAAFGEPVTTGAYTVITAAEVAVGGGFGSGSGHGPAGTSEDKGSGGGGGGGGGSNARPVAAIVIGPEGVTIRPIFDYTKVGLAFITALGAMWIMMGRMRRFGHR